MTTHAQALQQAMQALEANHKWHQAYDDYDGYAESELCTQNMAALAALATVSDASPSAVSDSEDAPERHYDDYAVDCFAQIMKAKLAKKRAEGRGGWNDPAQCSVEYLNRLLLDHVEKGDPVDVANFCMMLRHYGAKIATEPQKFDAWMTNPYTKVLQKSVKEDYVPKSTVQAAPSVPEGWQPVPKDPTPEMLHAQDRYLMRGVTRGSSLIWEAMLAAAPSAQEKAAPPTA